MQQINPTKIAIVYTTQCQHTLRLAESVAIGIDAVQITPQLINVQNLADIDWPSIHKAQAIIFASPTYMGGISGEMKLFFDKTGDFWLKQPWSNKIAAGMTVGTSPSGDKLGALIQMSIFAAQQGMIWVGQNHTGSKHTDDNLGINNNGSWLGLMATSVDRDGSNNSELISLQDQNTAQLFGQRVGEACKRWYGL